MRHLFLLLFPLLSITVFAQHRPDSVLYNNEWHYIYPVPEQLKASTITLREMGLIDEEFELYRVWYKKSDPRRDLKGKALRSALKQELIASKRMQESVYERRRKRNDKLFNQHRGWVRTWESGKRKTLRTKRFAALAPGILVTDELRIDNDLVPYVGELPDGRYIQYFDLFFSFDKQKNMRGLPQKVACVFSLSDNHPEGNYLRLAYDGDTLSYGTFTDGKREGMWKITHSYSNGLYTSFHRFHYFSRSHSCLQVDFRNGVPNGTFQSWEVGRLMSTGQLTNGKMSGNWEMSQWSWGLMEGVERVRFDIGNNADSLDWPEHRKVFFSMVPVSDRNGFRFTGSDRPPMEYPGDFLWSLVIYNQQINWKSSLKELDIDLYDISRESRYSQRIPGLYRGATYRYFEGFLENGQVSFRYRYDPVSKGVLGASFFENGQLFDTIGYDAGQQQFFRRIYDLDGRLYYEQLSDSSGEEISERYLNEPDEAIVWIDGLPASLTSLGYAWRNEENMLIGNRLYAQKTWFTNSRRLNNDSYTDSVAGVYVYTVYNGLEEPYYTRTVPLSLAQRRSEVMPDGDSLITTEYRWGSMKSMTVVSRHNGTEQLDRRFYYNNLPYTGTIAMNMTASKCAYTFSDDQLKIDFKWKELALPEHKRSTKREDRAAGLAHVQEIDFIDNWMEVMNDLLSASVSLEDVYTYTGRMENGKPVGEWIFYGAGKKELFRLQYSNELPNGTVRNFRKLPKKKAFRRNRYHYRFGAYASRYGWGSDAEFFEYDLKNGVLDGNFMRYWEKGDTMEIRHYRNGLLHGEQEVRDERQSITGTYDNGKRTGEFRMVEWNYAYPKISGKEWHIDTICRFQYENDQLNGTALLRPEYYETEQPYVSAFYRDDQPEGEMTLYENGTQQPVEKLFFENGLLVRRQFYTHGELSYFFEFPASDSIRIGSELINRKSREMDLEDSDEFVGSYDNRSSGVNVSQKSFLEQRKHSTLTRLYPNGNVARKGPMLYDTKSGHWEFFNYAGQQIYSIDYQFPGGEYLPGTEVKVIGYYTELDTLGNVLSKRAVIEEIEQYNCTHDEYYAIRQYVTLEDPADGIERTNGTIRNYFDNGMLMSEGQLTDGLPTGVWKFYTPDGKLHIVGRYEKGMKEGRWLTGDLTDKRYIGDICLDPDDPLLDFHVAEMERDLAIRVELFKNGVLQVKQEYDIHKND